MKVTWLGHACFRIEKNGYAIIVDPYEDGSVPGIGPVRERADLVLCSHEHFDHNARGTVEIVKGAAPCIKVTELETFHDDQQGALRGKTKMFVFDDGESRVAHLGDIGCEPTEAQKEFLAGVDILLIPVGGFYTLGAKEAASLTAELGPKYAVPMHYRNKEEGFGLEKIGTVYDYAALLEQVLILSQSSIDTSDDLPGRVVILQPANKEQ